MMKKLFPFVALFLLLAGAGSALLGCKDDAVTTALKTNLARTNKYKAIDDSIIRAYLGRHNYAAGSYTRTESGLYLVPITANPSGAVAATGKVVAVKYTGSLLDKDHENLSFDSSINGQTLCDCRSFTVGAGTIAGWAQGLPLMRQGERNLLLVPSYLAYGQTGGGNGSIIRGDTPLLFDMEIISVSK